MTSFRLPYLLPHSTHLLSVVPTTYARFCRMWQRRSLVSAIWILHSSFLLRWVPRWPLDNDRSGRSLHFCLVYRTLIVSNRINCRQEYETNVHIASIIKKKNERPQQPRHQSQLYHNPHHSHRKRDEQGRPPNGSQC
jgi:hypothetical protein